MSGTVLGTNKLSLEEFAFYQKGIQTRNKLYRTPEGEWYGEKTK